MWCYYDVNNVVYILKESWTFEGLNRWCEKKNINVFVVKKICSVELIVILLTEHIS